MEKKAIILKGHTWKMEHEFVVLELTSLVLLRRVVLIESATNHFWPFMTILYGGS
jgi:hypothetical protein